MAQKIGAQLKQIRETQGIPLEEIAHKTHISLVYLQSIEDGDDEALPSIVQLRGFLRLYAHELGVSLDTLEKGEQHPPIDEAPKPDEGETGLEGSREEPSSEEAPPAPQEPQESTKFDAALPVTPVIQPEISADATPLTESAQIFQSIGAKIQNRRELLSLSLKEVNENTRIREAYLASIEDGKFHQLPSPVQAKGMLVNYAEFLNLDTNALLLEYTDALQLQRIEKQGQLQQQKRRTARELSPTALRLKNFFSLDLLVILGLFITLTVFVIWGVNRILATDPAEDLENEIPGVSDVLLATDTPDALATQDPETDEITQQAPDEDVQEPVEPLFTPVVSTDPINVILIPRQRLWVRVTVDEEIVFQGRLLPGNAYDYSGQERVDILTGNAGALQILFNNEDIGSAGLIGRVAEISFAKSGLVSSPPSSPSLPEITPTPTPDQDDDETN